MASSEVVTSGVAAQAAWLHETGLLASAQGKPHRAYDGATTTADAGGKRWQQQQQQPTQPQQSQHRAHRPLRRRRSRAQPRLPPQPLLGRPVVVADYRAMKERSRQKQHQQQYQWGRQGRRRRVQRIHEAAVAGARRVRKLEDPHMVGFDGERLGALPLLERRRRAQRDRRGGSSSSKMEATAPRGRSGGGGGDATAAAASHGLLRLHTRVPQAPQRRPWRLRLPNNRRQSPVSHARPLQQLPSSVADIRMRRFHAAGASKLQPGSPDGGTVSSSDRSGSSSGSNCSDSDCSECRRRRGGGGADTYDSRLEAAVAATGAAARAVQPEPGENPAVALPLAKLQSRRQYRMPHSARSSGAAATARRVGVAALPSPSNYSKGLQRARRASAPESSVEQMRQRREQRAHKEHGKHGYVRPQAITPLPPHNVMEDMSAAIAWEKYKSQRKLARERAAAAAGTEAADEEEQQPVEGDETAADRELVAAAQRQRERMRRVKARAARLGLPADRNMWARHVAGVHGLLAQDTEQLKRLMNSTGYNRRELFAMFARFKALCALGSNPGAVEKHVFRRMPMLFVEDEAFTDRVFRMLDTNQSGVIEWMEFIHAMACLERGSTEEKARFLFKVYDQDGNGVLTRQDLREVFSATMDATESSGTNTELDVGEYMVRLAFDKMGLADCDKLTQEEFVRRITGHADTAEAGGLFGLFGLAFNRNPNAQSAATNPDATGLTPAPGASTTGLGAGAGAGAGAQPSVAVPSRRGMYTDRRNRSELYIPHATFWHQRLARQEARDHVRGVVLTPAEVHRQRAKDVRARRSKTPSTAANTDGAARGSLQRSSLLANIMTGQVNGLNSYNMPSFS